MKAKRFKVSVGTVQLFIVCDSPFLHVAASLPSYHVSQPVGTKWERKVAQWACDKLNASKSKATPTESTVEAMLKRGAKEVQYVS